VETLRMHSEQNIAVFPGVALHTWTR